MKASEVLVRTLEAHGVEYVFGVCGDTSVGLYRTLAELEHGITHVLARDERGAGYMADAYARLSNRPGVTEGPSGGGATYLLPGVAEANDSSVPLVALNTTIPLRYRGRGVLTELAQTRLFAPVTKYNAQADHPDHVPFLVANAFRHAITGRPGATHLALPMDVLDQHTTTPVPTPDDGTASCPAYRHPPEPARAAAAADVLNASERPVIVAGGGVHTSRAWHELRAFAEHLGIPVAETLTSAGCIGDSPYRIGVVGENGGRAYADDLLGAADVVCAFGTAVESVWTRKWQLPRDDQTVIHADIDPASIGKNTRVDVALPGDLRTTLDALEDHTTPTTKVDPGDLARLHEEWAAPYAAEAGSDAFPLRPERIVHDTHQVLDDNAVIISDPGTTCPYFAALYPFSTPGRHWLTPRAHGALGYALPASVGAHYARPQSTIVAFTGDGSLATTAGELETLARLDLPVTVVVINNASFSWIEAGQRSYADFSFGVDFTTTDYAGLADAFGVTGYTVSSAGDYHDTLRTATEHDGPALIDLPTTPLPEIENVPVEWLEPPHEPAPATTP